MKRLRLVPLARHLVMAIGASLAQESYSQSTACVDVGSANRDYQFAHDQAVRTGQRLAQAQQRRSKDTPQLEQEYARFQQYEMKAFEAARRAATCRQNATPITVPGMTTVNEATLPALQFAPAISAAPVAPTQTAPPVARNSAQTAASPAAPVTNPGSTSLNNSLGVLFGTVPPTNAVPAGQSDPPN